MGVCSMSTCWMGSCVAQSFKTLSCSHCVLTILSFSELSESTSAILMKSSGRRRASSRWLSGMSVPFGLERVSGKSSKIMGQTVLVTQSMMKVWQSIHVHDHHMACH